MFMKPENSSLVKVDAISKIPPGRMHIHYWDNQEFPVLTSDDFITRAGKAMRDVYEETDAANTKNRLLQDYIKKNYSIPTIAKKAKIMLQNFWEKYS